MKHPDLWRRLRLPSIPVLVLLALAAADSPPIRAAAQGQGHGFIRSEMPDNIIGSSTHFEFLRVLIHEPSQHSIDLKQYTRTITGQSGAGLYNLAGYLIKDATSLLPNSAHRGTTQASFYAFIRTGAGPDYYHVDSPGPIPLVATSSLTNKARVQLRLCQGDDCKCEASPQDCDYTWQAMWTDPGDAIHKTKHFHIPSHHDPPVRVLSSMVGVDARDVDPINDVHFRAYNYIAYERRCDDSRKYILGCPSQWNWPGGHVAWADISQYVTPGSGIQIYEPDGAEGWDFCMGNCPESRCGCYTCDPPAFGPGSDPAQPHNLRWEPKYQVLQYYIDTGSFRGSSFRKWVEEIDASAQLWNDSVDGQPILRRTLSEGQAQIVVIGDSTLNDSFGVFRLTDESVGDMSDWDCNPAPSDATFVQAEEGKIVISTDENLVRWTADPIYISDVSPSIRWARLTIAHEFGHVLGLSHAPLVCPNPPAPTATPFGNPTATPGPTPTLGPTQRDYPLLCSAKSNTWRTRVRINMQDYDRVIECLTFRGDN